jgi:hypothetical protein
MGISFFILETLLLFTPSFLTYTYLDISFKIGNITATNKRACLCDVHWKNV